MLFMAYRYPSALEFKKLLNVLHALLYLDILITVDNGEYTTAMLDKRDSFFFNIIVNFPISVVIPIPAKPAYGEYISQLVLIGRICEKRHYNSQRN